MASSIPTPLHIIQQDSRYAKQDDWQLDDISLCSSGNIAVSGHNDDTDHTYVCIYGSTVDNSDSRDKPTLLYHKQFTDKVSWLPRCFSFIKPNSTEIVTCLDDEVQVIDYNRDVVLRSRKVNGRTRCLSVSESQIFIGLVSDIVNIYDNDLNRIKSIRLKGIRDDRLRDIAAAADRLYVCTGGYDYRAIVYSQDSGSILTEYTTGQYGSEALSMAVNMQHQIVAVLWDRKQVAVYSINSNNCLLVFNVECGVSRIRISDNGRIVTGNEDRGEVKIYEFAQFFTYDNLKVTLSSLLSESDLKVLLEYFKISEDSLIDSNDGSSNDKDKYANLLQILEEKGILHHEDFHQLKEAFCHLGSHHSSMVMSFVDFYQEYAGKVSFSSPTQTNIDAEGGHKHKLQLNGFSGNWSEVDISLGPEPSQNAVISGYNISSGKTSLDFIHGKDLNSSPWWRTSEFIGGSKKSKRFVSFIDESQIVTCCHNIAEIIDINTNESKSKTCLPVSESASCVTVRNKNIYVGFENSVDILVLNVDSQEKMKIKLKKIENMWPLDLAVSIGRLLVCVGNMSSSKVFLFTEVDGKKLLEYRIDVDKAKAPVSVAIHEESDLAAILWDIEDDDEDEEYHDMDQDYHADRTYGYLSLHSLSQGYCLSVVSVGLSVHDFDFDCECYKGCSSGKKVRISSDCVAVLDTMSGVKFFDMKKMFTPDSVKTALCQMISSDDCQELVCSSEETGGASDNTKKECKNSDTQNVEDDEQSNCSKTENSDDDAEEDENEDEDNDTESSSESELDNSEDDEDIRLSSRGMHLVDIILAILTDKNHMKLDDVSVLKEEISHTISSHYARSVEKVISKREPLQCYRFKRDDEDYYDDYGDDYDEKCRNGVHISFGSYNEIAVSHFRPRANMRSVSIYYWDKTKEMQPSLSFYRRFKDGRSKVFVSFLNGCQAVTCCDDLIEITDFDAHGKVIKYFRLSSAGTCMSTKDGDIFVGFKSSTIVVLDSELVEKRSVTVNFQDREWPDDLAVVPGKLFVCTDGTSQRALSFNLEDGRQLMEYTYKRSQVYDDLYPLSITVSESLDIVGISWCAHIETFWKYEEVNDITLHSLSKGFCVSIVNDHSARIIRFSPYNYMFMISRDEDIKYSLVDEIISFDTWKTGFAHSFSSCEYEMLIAFYHLSAREINDKLDDKYLRDSRTMNEGRIKHTIEILIAKGYITSSNVTSLKKAFADLGKLYVDRLLQPLDAYIKYASETSCITERPDSVLSVPSDNIAESLLQLQHSVHGKGHSACVNTVYQQGILSQRYPGQSSSQGQVSSSLPYTNNAPVTESLVHGDGKRACVEGDHSATDNGLHAKRAKTGEKEPGANGHMNSTDAGTGETSNTNLGQLITQIHRTPSFLQLMEGDSPPIPTNPHVYRPVTPAKPIGPTQLQTLPLPVVAQPTISHQSSVDTTSHQMSIVQAGLQHINQVLNTPYQVGEGVQSQTNLHIGCPTSVSQSHVPIMTQQQIMRQAIQPNIPQGLPQVLPQPRYSVPSLYRQPILSPQVQPVGQPVTQQREPCVIPNLPTSSYHQNGRSQGQGVFLELRQNVVQQQTHNSVHSLISSVAEVVNPNTGTNTGDFAGNAMSQDHHQPVTEKSNQVEQREDLNAQGNIQQILQLEPPNSVSHEVQATGRGVEQLQSSVQPGTQHSIGQTNRRDWESVPTTSQQISEEMTSVVQSCVQRVVTPFLKDISDKLGHLLGSSRTVYSQQDIPGTSSQSNNNALDSAAHSSHSRDSEHDEEVTSAWESLSEYNRMSLQAFRGMTDDRAELVRRLVEMVFTEEERRNQNCFGKSGKQKLDENKLRKVRHITFYLCPMITKKTDIDKLSLEDVEWKRLCEVIDKANRHFREKLKRQGRER